MKDWSSLQADIRANPGKEVTLTVERDGGQLDLTTTLIKNQLSKTDGDGGYVQGEYVYAGFLGFTPATGVVQQSFSQSVDRMGDMMENGVESLISLPAKVPALWDAAFGDGPREDDSPVGVVGAARIGGEIATMDIPATQRLATFLMLVAGFNLSLFLFNMLPLLPLDGGHIAGALWESLRRNVAKVLRRPDPGPFDVAKLMPVAYVVAGIFICFTLLVLVGGHRQPSEHFVAVRHMECTAAGQAGSPAALPCRGGCTERVPSTAAGALNGAVGALNGQAGRAGRGEAWARAVISKPGARR